MAANKNLVRAIGQTPYPVYLLKLFTCSNSIQMSRVTDKLQKVSGTLLLSNHKSNVHHHRVMREVKANTNHAHLYQIQRNSKNKR